MALDQGATAIDYNADDPVEAILNRTGGIGVDRAIDAVGVDANHPRQNVDPQEAETFKQQVTRLAPETNPWATTGIRATRRHRSCSGPWSPLPRPAH